jgi:PAS domain S-box-containing protein
MTRTRGSATHDRARKRAHAKEEKPLESELYLRSLPDALSFGIVLCDSAGKVTYANPAAERLLGLELAQMQGKAPTDFDWRLVHENEAPVSPEEYPSARARLTREPVRGCVMGLSAGMEQARWLRVDAVPVLDAEGAVREVVVSFIDISDRRRSELEREQLYADARSARADAETARQAAEAANAAKSQFLATMSHEIRTPINAMLGYTQLIEMGIAGAVSVEQHGYLARIRQSSEHLLTLVDEVLDIAKLDAGSMLVAREPAIAGMAIKGAISLTSPQAQAKGIRLLHTGSGGPGVRYMGDEQRVRQILVNLLSNAIKFTGAGGTVAVRSGITTDGPHPGRPDVESWAFIQVEDTGTGIAAEAQPRIFEPFHQVEAGHTRRAGGTGLGLTISRRLARLMNGDLTFESEAGRGSTFTLWLPTAAQGESAQGAPLVAHGARDPAAEQVHGLMEAGLLLNSGVEQIQSDFVARLLSDPHFPGAQLLDSLVLEDHLGTFLTSIGESLITIEESDGLAQNMLKDGAEIQRAIAELHGRQRHRIGWNDVQIAREHDILTEEIELFLRHEMPDRQNDTTAAIVIIRQLIGRARDACLRAYRHAEAEAESGVE